MENMKNGIDVDKLMSTIGAIQDNPDLGAFHFRAKSAWRGAGHAETSIKGFYGAGQEDTSRDAPFIVEADEPPVLLGGGQAPNAVELVLAALGSCLTVGLVYNAAAQGVKLNSLEFTMEGDVDLRGFLGLSESVRPGFENIRITCRFSSDAAPKKLNEIWEHVQRTSPVLDICRNPVPVTLILEQAMPAGGVP
jgi:uncharacterized OsmC-like protein